MNEESVFTHQGNLVKYYFSISDYNRPLWKGKHKFGGNFAIYSTEIKNINAAKEEPILIYLYVYWINSTENECLEHYVGYSVFEENTEVENIYTALMIAIDSLVLDFTKSFLSNYKEEHGKSIPIQ